MGGKAMKIHGIETRRYDTPEYIKRVKPPIRKWLGVSTSKWKGHKIKINEDFSVSILP